MSKIKDQIEQNIKEFDEEYKHILDEIRQLNERATYLKGCYDFAQKTLAVLSETKK